ncbi:AAA family ATPase [Bacillus mycoides]|uniref:AAA family ATPase n=1 Tax=Bacillus mycoides TaxID=1405 RepID=UPI003D019F31
MNGQLLKKLMQSIANDNDISLRQIANTVIDEEKKKGHNKLAKELEDIMNSPKTKSNKMERNVNKSNYEAMTTLPLSKRNNQTLVTVIDHSKLKHHMILDANLERRFDKIEKEFAAKERLAKYNLQPKQKILLYGPPGCGKTLGAERLAWNLGLPLIKVKFDAIISSYFGESAANLRAVFEMSNERPCVLLLDECDFIAKARNYGQDVGEVPRIVNTLLMLLDEYEAPGLLVATTNLENSLDQALFRRFDEVIEMTRPTGLEIKRVFDMTLSSFSVDKDVNWDVIIEKVKGHSYASVVKIAKNAAKSCILEGKKQINQKYIELSILEVKRH